MTNDPKLILDQSIRQPVILVARPAAGGILSHITALLEHLDRSKFDITVAAPKALLDRLPDSLPEFNSVSLPITSKTTPLDLIAAVQLANLTRDYAKPIVHAHGVRAGFVCSLARLIHEFTLITTHHNIPTQGPLSKIVLELIDFGCAKTIAVSNAIAQALPGTDTTVIPNGIDLQKYGNLNRANARHQFGLSDTDFCVASLGRLSREKGMDLILRAALLCPDITFLIGGDGPERERLLRSCPSNVRLLGRIANPADLFAAADIAVVPSRAEGQGIVALEAMACSVPVIATYVGGLIETIDQSDGGILVEPESPIAIVDAIDQLRNDPKIAQAFAESGRTWVTKNCAVKDRVDDVARVYSQLAPNAPPPE